MAARLLVVPLAVCLAACASSANSVATDSPTSGGPTGIPLASSRSTPTGVWSALPMGDLSQSVNTFWELVDSATGSAVWELATPPGVASNGGLVLSSGTSATVVAGFEPSIDLRFSPLATSSDQGATWSPGVLPGGLAPVPDAIASSGEGRHLALSRAGGGSVMVNGGDLVQWIHLASIRDVTGSDRSCGLDVLTAVSFAPNGDALVGGGCARGTDAGVFEREGGSWRPVGPPLPAAPRPVVVVRLQSDGSGTSALVSEGSGGSRRLVALRRARSSANWSVSAALPLGTSSLTSTAVTAAGGFVVTAARRSGGVSVSVVEPSEPDWSRLVDPPDGTSVVAAPAGGAFEALAPHGSKLHVYRLHAGSWAPTQVLDVPIQYGSSG